MRVHAKEPMSSPLWTDRGVSLYSPSVQIAQKVLKGPCRTPSQFWKHVQPAILGRTFVAEVGRLLDKVGPSSDPITGDRSGG